MKMRAPMRGSKSTEHFLRFHRYRGCTCNLNPNFAFTFANPLTYFPSCPSVQHRYRGQGTKRALRRVCLHIRTIDKVLFLSRVNEHRCPIRQGRSEEGARSGIRRCMDSADGRMSRMTIDFPSPHGLPSNFKNLMLLFLEPFATGVSVCTVHDAPLSRYILLLFRPSCFLFRSTLLCICSPCCYWLNWWHRLFNAIASCLYCCCILLLMYMNLLGNPWFPGCQRIGSRSIVPDSLPLCLCFVYVVLLHLNHSMLIGLSHQSFLVFDLNCFYWYSSCLLNRLIDSLSFSPKTLEFPIITALLCMVFSTTAMQMDTRIAYMNLPQ